jgi:hypothetical protein
MGGVLRGSCVACVPLVFSSFCRVLCAPHRSRRFMAPHLCSVNDEEAIPTNTSSPCYNAAAVEAMKLSNIYLDERGITSIRECARA